MAEGNRVFTESQEGLLKEVVNCIVPAEDGFPGAGDLGVASHIDATIAESAAMKKLFLAGLAHVEITAFRTLGRDFAGLSPEEKYRALRQVEQEESDFWDALVQQTYNGYYTDPAILSLIRQEARPPQPRGYPMRPFDLKLLDNVRNRAPLYRRV